MKKSAVISKDEKYRYELSRIWDEKKPAVLLVMLNPSTADANKDDPTIRRCIAFAKQWGYGGLYVGNLFAYRSTNPKALLKARDPIGKDNEKHLMSMQKKVDMTVCAWGHGEIVDKIQRRIGREHLPLTGDLHALDYNQDGIPKHPLYMKKSLTPFFHISVRSSRRAS